MKEIWTKEEAEFHGEFLRFRKIWAHTTDGASMSRHCSG